MFLSAFFDVFERYGGILGFVFIVLSLKIFKIFQNIVNVLNRYQIF